MLTEEYRQNITLALQITRSGKISFKEVEKFVYLGARLTNTCEE